MAAVILSAHQTSHAAPRNIILVISDDHRYDFMSHHEDAPSFLETPHLDQLAESGARFANSFVSTSLCSPSRATMLTGQYMHHHQVVDNQRPVPPGTRFFVQQLQAAGYQTAFIGKWHMGHESDEPRPGFDYWVSFAGQGVYRDPVLNINGTRQRLSGYTTDVLTAQAMKYLTSERNGGQPFCLIVSYKAVHYPFQPAPRHLGKYNDEKIPYPNTMANTESNYRTQPRWVRERRYSIHGIDHMETGNFDQDPVPNFDDLYHRYCETVHGLDENIGVLLNYVGASGLADTTAFIYTSDNGFELGEHGFYDKRDAFEESIRVPLLISAPGLIAAETVVEQLVQNIDLAPSILELCEVAAADDVRFDGQSWVGLAKNPSADVNWRDHILYEYHWEWNFPATPTTFAIRDERYKYVFYHGVWDQNGLYDLKTDPDEKHNLISLPNYADRVASMQTQLFQELGQSGGLQIPVRPPAGDRLDQRKNPR